MRFLSDPRRRLVALLAAGALSLIALFGGLQAFNTSNIRFLNPETSGETLAFTALTFVVFLLLLLLLLLLRCLFPVQFRLLRQSESLLLKLTSKLLLTFVNFFGE